MKHNNSKSVASMENEPTPSAEDLLRMTSRSHPQPNGRNDGSHDAFEALGEVLENAASDFDWKKITARLEAEIASEVGSLVLTRNDLSANTKVTASRSRTFAWLSLTSAIVLLALLTLSLGLNPSANRFHIAQSDSKNGGEKMPSPKAPAIDSWAQTPQASESSLPWNDEIDVKLAATQRALKQGRDPWVGDEPALSEVFAQIGELTAGLAFEPF
jgi:hypothetical protein